ncbi:MAG: cytochrome c3 family protein [Myxococcota bacterium]|nr:cytochrome c3 family protein [Myxococcota bacterium]
MKIILILIGLGGALLGCQMDPEPYTADEAFPKGQHILFPPAGADHVTAGHTTLGDPDYIEEQPLMFNHAIHSGAVEDGGMGMECTYCHSTARHSASAGIPSTQGCWNCHKQINPALSMNDDRNWTNPETGEVERNASGKGALETLDEYCGAEMGTPTCVNEDPIPWNRVHDLPDFSHFNHSMHVRLGADGEPRVECQECHGAMQEKMVAERVSSLLMGWCLECHQDHPSVDENYGTQSELRRAELKDCYTCHK